MVKEKDGGTRTSAVDGQVQSSSMVPKRPGRVDICSCVLIASLPLTRAAIQESTRSLRDEVARREIEPLCSVDRPISRDQPSQVTGSNERSKQGTYR